jgi:hypothetical protein
LEKSFSRLTVTSEKNGRCRLQTGGKLHNNWLLFSLTDSNYLIEFSLNKQIMDFLISFVATNKTIANLEPLKEKTIRIGL